MHDLLPYIPAQLNHILDSMIYFMPEICLCMVFLFVLLTDIIFGKNSEKLCRVVAYAGMVLVIFKDLQQLALVLNNTGHSLFSDMLVLNIITGFTMAMVYSSSKYHWL